VAERRAGDRRTDPDSVVVAHDPAGLGDFMCDGADECDADAGYGLAGAQDAWMRGSEECSFLKKRTKKLLLLWMSFVDRRASKIKSFLLLFFKKEGLPSLLRAGAHCEYR
jgi:hypothetical protein